jgi:NAD(P)-dependent dehydrogenase (short-subunit alcohol dehydrogenase family)
MGDLFLYFRINAVAPGITEPESLERGIGNNKQARETLVALHPIGLEIANAVVWLLSDKASFVTGHTLLVKSGWWGANWV